MQRTGSTQFHCFASSTHPADAPPADRDQRETLSQNYKRIGLSSRLNASAWCAPKSAAFTPAAAPKVAARKLQPGEARIVRDETGAVVRVEHAASAEEALDEEWHGLDNDGAPDDDDNASTQGRATTEVVRQLEELARSGVKRERTQGQRECEWIERLVARYGRDFKKMAKDRKLNPFQQTEGDIGRRVAKWERAQAKTQGGTKAQELVQNSKV